MQLALDLRQAAAALGVGKTTVYRLVKAGVLPHVKLGERSKLLVPVEELQEVLKERTRWGDQG